MPSVFIQQPYFLPWIGFFAKLKLADIYVYMDDSGFRRDHLSRTGVRGSDGKRAWLKVPIGGSQGERISELPLPVDDQYVRKIVRTIELSYGKAHYFPTMFPIIKELVVTCLYREIYSDLVSANMAGTEKLSNIMAIPKIKWLPSSEIQVDGDRTDRLISICRHVEADRMIAGDGGTLSAHDIPRILRSGISMDIVPFARSHPVYLQVHRSRIGGEFIPGLSILDALLNVGIEGTRKLISHGAECAY